MLPSLAPEIELAFQIKKKYVVFILKKKNRKKWNGFDLKALGNLNVYVKCARLSYDLS